MRPDQITDAFYDLFAGRTDAYGTVYGAQVKEPVTRAHYDSHLNLPGHSLGVYPLIQQVELAEQWERRMGGPVGDNFVAWGCSDIDNKADPDACWPLALNLQGALGALGITSWIERTKGKGYHVWVFADEWVPAIVMRRALLVAHQVAGVAPTEVNPKQTDAGTRVTYGNYVNLPYPHGWEATGRRLMLNEHGTFPLDVFLGEAWDHRTSFGTLHAAAKLYKPPPKKHVTVDRPIELSPELVKRLPGLAYTIFTKGPLEGRDRSGTLQRLAFLCAEAEFTPAETLAVVTDADARWGKFQPEGRVDAEEQLMAIVEYAHGRVGNPIGAGSNAHEVH